MNIYAIPSPLKRRSLIILTLLILPFALLGVAALKAVTSLVEETQGVLAGLPSVWKGPKLSILAQADRVNRRLLRKTRARCIVAVPLFPFAFLFDLVLALGHVVAKEWRSQIRDASYVLRDVVVAWRGQ
jgi:hypothetical protein